MIDLNDLYNSFKSYVNTYQGGFYRPQTDFTSACNDISLKLWTKWTNMADKSFEVQDNLMPFLRRKNIVVTQKTTYGSFAAPKDYGRFSAARVIVVDEKTVPDPEVNSGKCEGVLTEDQKAEQAADYHDRMTENEVGFLTSAKWAAVLKHAFKGPTVEKPKIRQVNNEFHVAPRQVSVIVLDYYVLPKPATFKYTVIPGNVQTGAGDLIQYDKANSSPLEWPDSMRDEFLIQLGERYGLFTRDSFVAQVAGQQKTA